MNSDNTTIIICCAGMGTRLGIGTTKALIDVGGEASYYSTIRTT